MKTSEMLELLNRHEFFLTDYFVAVLNLIKDKNTEMEMKFLAFMKNSIAFQPFGPTTPSFRKHFKNDHIRNRVILSLFEKHNMAFRLIESIESKEERLFAHTPLINHIKKGRSFSRAFSLLLLSRLGHSETNKTLLAKFPEFSKTIRWGIIAILSKVGDPAWVSLFLAALNDPQPDVIRLSVTALGWSGNQAATPKLIKLLSHSKIEVVLASIKALSYLKDSRSVQPLIKISSSAKFKKIRSTAVSALGEFVETDTLTALVQHLNDPEPRTRANAVLAIKKILLSKGKMDKPLIGKIKSLLNDENNRVKADAIQALWELGYVDSILEIEPMLRDINPRVRGSAAYLCGKLKLHQFKDNLLELMDDKSWPVRRMSAISFFLLGKENRNTLESLLYKGTHRQQVCSAFALGLSGKTEAIDELVSRSSSDEEIAQLTGELWLQIPKYQEGA